MTSTHQVVQLFGSSHIGCIASAYQRYNTDNIKNIYRFKSIMDFIKNSRIIDPVDGDFKNYSLNEVVEKWLASSLQDVDALCLSISGSDYLPLCVAMPTNLYDVILPQEQHLPILQHAQIIPYAELKKVLKQRIRHIVLGIKTIKELVPLPIYYLESPPPIEDNDYIFKYSDWAKPLIEASGGLSPPILRYKLWRLHSYIIKEACDDADVNFIEVPRSGLNERGFLAKNAYNCDLMHAGVSFGLAYLEHLEAIFRG